jgi:hypothetical protein
MTDDDTTDDRTGTDRSTLGDMTHTNPHTGEAFGATQTYDRGRTIAADGGSDPEREAEAEAAEDAEPDDVTASAEEPTAPEGDQLRDVDHTAPGDAEGANQVYERGREGRDESA